MIIRRILATLRIVGRKRPAPELVFVFTDPVQEIAAEPGTLDRLRSSLHAECGAVASPSLALPPLTGWPLVHDDRLPPGLVQCRPTPGAPPPLTAAQIEGYMRALMPKQQPDG